MNWHSLFNQSEVDVWQEWAEL